MPSDGILIAQTFNAEQASVNYSVNLTAAYSAVPEPGTSVLAGLGVALGGALRRRRSQKR